MLYKELLKENLNKKLAEEYDAFIEKVMENGTEYAIKNSYEILIKEEIKDYMSSKDLSLKMILALLKQDNFINETYNKWMHTDVNLFTALEDTVNDYTNKIEDKYYEKGERKEDIEYEQRMQRLVGRMSNKLDRDAR